MNETIFAPLGMAVTVCRKDHEKALRDVLDTLNIPLLRLDIGVNLPACVVSRYAVLPAQIAIIDVAAIEDIDGLAHALTAVRMLNDGLRVILICEPDMPKGCPFASAVVSCGIYDLIQGEDDKLPIDALADALECPATFGTAARWLVRGEYIQPDILVPRFGSDDLPDDPGDGAPLSRPAP